MTYEYLVEKLVAGWKLTEEETVLLWEFILKKK